jgi:trans-feruloyl-CoA hydratase/vanillin synthase
MVGQVQQYETILVEATDAVATLTLNRPEKRNAINPVMIRELYQALEVLEADPSVGVVILTGARESFSAGLDLKEYFEDTEHDEFERNRNRRLFTDLTLRNLGMFPKPTIAQIHGYCFGGAFQLVWACDFAFAADDATFGLSEVNWGTIPAGLVAKVLTAAVPFRDALYYAMTGFRFDGARAAEIRLVNEAVPASQLPARTLELARHMTELDPAAVRATKETLKQVMGMTNEQAAWWLLSKSNELAGRHAREGHRPEGIQRFLDKRYRPGFESFTTTEESTRPG